jgi:hypothetical protein
MNKILSPLYAAAMASMSLCACVATNRSVDGGESLTTGTSAGLLGDWCLDSFLIDSEMALYDGSSDCQLQFDEPDNSFSLSTDCNMIGGWFGTHKLHHPFKKHTRHRDGLRQYDC